MEKNKVAVIYKSTYGSAKKYAEKISLLTNGELFQENKMKIGEIPYYNTIVYVGSVHAGKIQGINLILKNMNKIEEKKLVVVAVGITDNNKEQINKLFKDNIPEEHFDKMEKCYLRGALDVNNLKLHHKLVMKVIEKVLSKKSDALDESAKDFINILDNPHDFTDEEDITPIIKIINS